MRKCRLLVDVEYGYEEPYSVYSEEVYKFHQWANGVTKSHQEDSQKDYVYSETYGIVEHPSGEIRCVNPTHIKFISEP